MNENDLIMSLIRDSRSNPSEDIATKVLSLAGYGDDLAKSITTASGLVAYDLQAPAKNLYPFVTPIRNRLPRVEGGRGLATNWRQVSALTGSGFDNSPWVPEGQRAGKMAYATANKSASYVTLGEEDDITFEADHAGRTFEDLRASMTFRLLQKAMLKEEAGIIWGNNSLSVSAPATPTLSASGSGATLPAATYSVIAVALTGEGYFNSSLVNGVATSATVTGADGQTFTLNGGSSNKSSAGSQAVTLGQTLFCSVPVVSGAVAYAWYVGVSGSEKLERITTINSAAFSAPLAATHQAATAITANCSTNSTAFDGLVSTAANSANGASVTALATGTAGTGTVLTASGRGSVNEIDNMLQAMYDTYQLSPTVLYVNSQQIKDITAKCLSSGSGPLLQYFKDANAGEYALTAGGVIEYYFNPFSNNGGTKIPIKIHPKAVPGTIFGWCEDLPAQYQSNNVPNVAEMRIRQAFYQIDWPLVTRKRASGVYIEEVLAVYAPFAMGLLQNVAAG
jgi:hypothetical protein